MTKTSTQFYKGTALKHRDRSTLIYSLDNDEGHFSTYIRTVMNQRLLSPSKNSVKIVLDFAKQVHSC